MKINLKALSLIAVFALAACSKPEPVVPVAVKTAPQAVSKPYVSVYASDKTKPSALAFEAANREFIALAEAGAPLPALKAAKQNLNETRTAMLNSMAPDEARSPAIKEVIDKAIPLEKREAFFKAMRSLRALEGPPAAGVAAEPVAR